MEPQSRYRQIFGEQWPAAADHDDRTGPVGDTGRRPYRPRDATGLLGPHRDQTRPGGNRVVVDDITMDSNRTTTDTGSEATGAYFTGGRIWWRANADIRPGIGRKATFSYRTDGVDFTLSVRRLP